MAVWVCATCANHYPDTGSPPGKCVICADERQWVPSSGQRWTTLAELAAAGHRGDVRAVEPGLLGVGADPQVAIGQRGLVVQTAEGNLLWDPPGFLDESSIQAGADILLPRADAHWLTRPDPAVRTWSGTLDVLPGVTLIQCGGHFPGSAVVHWASGADGAGALLTGDTIFVTPGEDRLTFVWSAPNRLPLPEASIRGILGAVQADPFDRIYGGWAPAIRSGARAVLEASAERYIQF